MFPFDVILFDVGGVLLTNGWDHRERAVAMEHFHLDLADSKRGMPRLYDAWERDAISLKAYLDATVFYEPRSFSQDDFFGVHADQSKLLPDGALGILEELAASDKCLVGALNNEARETNEYRFESFGLRNYFQCCVEFLLSGTAQAGAGDLSARAGYSGQARRSGFCLSTTGAENVAGAAAAGMKTIRFEGRGSLRERIGSLEHVT